VKALLYTLTLLLFCGGAGASEQPADQAVLAGHAQLSVVSTPFDPAPSYGAGWAIASAVADSAASPDHAAPLLSYRDQACASAMGHYSIRAPPARLPSGHRL
jgi:hypothetical protein